MDFFMIQINPDFQKLIPPLSEEEKSQLESNLIADGCRDPLVLWGDTLIDGHNRFEICTRLNIPFQTISKEFDSENAVKEWMILNQFGRRNLNNFVRAELALKLKPVIAEKARENLVATGGDKKSELAKSGCQNSDKPIIPIDTKIEIAKATNVSHDTIARAEFILKEAAPDIVEKVRAGEVSINQAYIERDIIYFHIDSMQTFGSLTENESLQLSALTTKKIAYIHKPQTAIFN